MASPTSRDTLTEHCLRRLGAPVIEINVDPDQVEDCIDDTIQFYQEFHSDATYRTYLKHTLTADDVANEWIPVSSDVHYVKSLLNYSESNIGTGSGMFSLKYQIAMSDLHNAGTFFGNIQYYYQMGQYLNTLDMILTGTPITEFQRKGNRLHIFGEFWDQELDVGDIVIYECYVVIDPETQTSVYNDIFVKNYTTALIKQRWGQNMSKFEGMQLPGGVTISGERILAEANAEIERLEDKMRLEYEPMPDFFVG